MSSDNLIESFCCLVGKLDIVDDNKIPCRDLKRTYRTLLASNNIGKKADVSNQLHDIIRPVYNANRDLILLKDFSFLSEAEGIMVIEQQDIGTLYTKALDCEDDSNITLLMNEMLYLFYQVAPSKDKKILDDKYRRPSNKKTSTSSSTPQPNLAKQMEKILEKNKHKLKKAENDPNAIPDVLADLFKNNSDDMAGILTGMLGSMGIDPAQMKSK
jgi:hypothetical protein